MHTSVLKTADNDITANAWKSVGVGAFIILALTFVAYMPAMRGGFVWDDYPLIVENPLIKANDGLHRFWFTSEAPDYYPMTESLWWLEWRLWGDHAAGYHLLNILLHAGNAVLVWLVLKRLKIPGAWLAGLIFAIHPVNVASVAWISEQKNTFSMMFYLIAILMYLEFDALGATLLLRGQMVGESGPDRTGQWRWYALSIAAFLLALLSKTSVVMLPIVLLGCIWWLRGRIRWKQLLHSLPFFALSLVLGLVTIWFQYQRVLEGKTVRVGGGASRLATAGWVPWFYLYKAFVPVNLSVIYRNWHIGGYPWLAFLPGAALLGCLAVFWSKRKTWGRPLLFAFGYFVVVLFPVWGFFNQGFYRYSKVADHWQYLAIIAPIALAVATGVAICGRSPERNRYIGLLAGMAIVIALGAATWKRSRVYETDATLWRDTITKNPECWLAHANLGEDLWRAGMRSEAIKHYREALRLKPDYYPAHYDLGLILWQTGQQREAVEQWEQALQINPHLAVAHYTLGVASMRAGDTNAAIQQWEQTVRIDPADAQAQNDLGSALLLAGRAQEAIGHYQRALRIEPDRAEVHYNLGLALERAGRLSEARMRYEEALKLKPNYAEPRRALTRLQAHESLRPK